MWITWHGCKEWHEVACLPLQAHTLHSDFFSFTASCNTGHFIFKSPRCTTTKGSNYPIPVISLHPTQKTQIARKLRKPRFNQYHMLFYLFTVTFLPKQGLWIPRAVNSTVFMFQLCWAVSWHVARPNIIITNSVLWTGQKGGGDVALSFSVFPQALSVTFQGRGKVLKYTDKETFNPLIALQGCYRLGRRSGT